MNDTAQQLRSQAKYQRERAEAATQSANARKADMEEYLAQARNHAHFADDLELAAKLFERAGKPAHEQTATYK